MRKPSDVSFITTGDESNGHVFEVRYFGQRWRGQLVDGTDAERCVIGPTFFGGTHTELASKCLAYHRRNK